MKKARVYARRDARSRIDAIEHCTIDDREKRCNQREIEDGKRSDP